MNTTTSGAVFDLEYFFELSPDLLCVTGYDGYFKKINIAVLKTLGYTSQELFASPVNSFIHPDDQAITAQKRTILINGAPLLNFENRFIAKDGSVIWLSWTSVPIKRDKLIFAIAKNITYRKQVEEYDRISVILEMINDDHKKRFKKEFKTGPLKTHQRPKINANESRNEEPSQSDQHWLNSFEAVVRKYTGKLQLNLNLISSELAVSDRQLYRRVDQILGITPNKLVRIIRLQLAWEAIASGKYRTVTEISNIAGYSSRAHFSKLFKEVYGIDVLDLL
nr:PAS domain S-box protein [uncultured Mucilaginibacter sp.]